MNYKSMFIHIYCYLIRGRKFITNPTLIYEANNCYLRTA